MSTHEGVELRAYLEGFDLAESFVLEVERILLERLDFNVAGCRSGLLASLLELFDSVVTNGSAVLFSLLERLNNAESSLSLPFNQGKEHENEGIPTSDECHTVEALGMIIVEHNPMSLLHVSSRPFRKHQRIFEGSEESRKAMARLGFMTEQSGDRGHLLQLSPTPEEVIFGCSRGAAMEASTDQILFVSLERAQF